VNAGHGEGVAAFRSRWRAPSPSDLSATASRCRSPQYCRRPPPTNVAAAAGFNGTPLSDIGNLSRRGTEVAKRNSRMSALEQHDRRLWVDYRQSMTGRDRPRVCQNSKSLDFRVSLFPSQRATKPTQSVLTSRVSRGPVAAHVLTPSGPGAVTHRLFLAPQPERPVRQYLRRFVAGGRRKAQAALHSCDQKRDSPARPVGYHANPLRSSSL